VERQVRKSAAALVLGHHLGEMYDALVTGVTPKGTFVRTLHPPADGLLHIHDGRHVEVGQKLGVRLQSVDVERGFIDFVPA